MLPAQQRWARPLERNPSLWPDAIISGETKEGVFRLLTEHLLIKSEVKMSRISAPITAISSCLHQLLYSIMQMKDCVWSVIV
jgi:hypothetical protein